MYATLQTGAPSFVDPNRDPFGQIDGCFNDNQGLRPADTTNGLLHTIFATEHAVSYFDDPRINPLGR